MKKKVIVLLVALNSYFLLCQEEIGKFVLDLKESNTGIRDVFPVVNKKTSEYVLFVSDAKNVYAYKFNNNFEVIGKIISERKQREFSSFFGYSISNTGDYYLFMRERNNEINFLRITFSFDSNTTKLTKFSLNNYSGDTVENFVKAFSHNNKFYIISVAKKSKGFFIREIYDDEINTFTIGKKTEKFISKKDKKISVGKLIHKNRFNISIIDEQLPNTIEIVGEPIKIYKRTNSLIFSFDGNHKKSQFLKINLEDFSDQYLSFNKPIQNIESKKKTNSFLLNNELLLITSIFEGTQVDILDFTTGIKKKDFKIFRTHKEIKFKNSPILQKGGFLNNNREIEGVRNFLRKLNLGKIGIALRKTSADKYQMTIGGYINQSSGVVMPMYSFGAIGGIIIAINQTQIASNSYNNTKSIRIECLLDLEFNHIKGHITKNIFDKVNDFERSIKVSEEKDKEEITFNSSKSVSKSSSSVTNFDSSGNILFKYDGYFVKTFYNKNKKEFTFRKFTE